MDNWIAWGQCPHLYVDRSAHIFIQIRNKSVKFNWTRTECNRSAVCGIVDACIYWFDFLFIRRKRETNLNGMILYPLKLIELFTFDNRKSMQLGWVFTVSPFFSVFSSSKRKSISREQQKEYVIFANDCMVDIQNCGNILWHMKAHFGTWTISYIQLTLL